MSKELEALMANTLIESMLCGGNNYSYMPRLSKGGTQKTYTNKNANIEYYTDEKGNIRKRKIGG